MSKTSVPVIDIFALNGNDPIAMRKTALEIGKACNDIGFFVVVNHGMPQQVIEEAWSLALRFFDCPMADKAKLTTHDEAEYPYGYVKLGGEQLSRGKSAEVAESLEYTLPTQGDMKEMFAIGPHNPASGIAARRLPEEPEGFATAFAVYYDEANRLAQRILSAFALALDLPENWFEDKMDRHCSALRANNYPCQNGMVVPEGSIRASAHTDYGTLTVLRSGGPGLQVCKDLGTQGKAAWQDVPYIEDSFVINLGDLMRRWTNERWCSTLHRVINPPTDAAWGRRMALAFFHNLNSDVVVEAIPSCVSDVWPPIYDPIVAGDFLMLKHLASVGQAAPDAHLARRVIAKI